MFLNTLGTELAQQMFSRGGRVVVQLESPKMSMAVLIEKLLATPLPSISQVGNIDGIEVGDETISFKCPYSLCHIKYPGKGKNCAHAQCFDLEVYICFGSIFSLYSLEPRITTL